MTELMFSKEQAVWKKVAAAIQIGIRPFKKTRVPKAMKRDVSESSSIQLVYWYGLLACRTNISEC